MRDELFIYPSLESLNELLDRGVAEEGSGGSGGDVLAPILDCPECIGEDSLPRSRNKVLKHTDTNGGKGNSTGSHCKV